MEFKGDTNYLKNNFHSKNSLDTILKTNNFLINSRKIFDTKFSNSNLQIFDEMKFVVIFHLI